MSAEVAGVELTEAERVALCAAWGCDGSHEQQARCEAAMDVVGRVIAERLEAAEAALVFYADPESYDAIGFWADRPAGGFADDFDENHGHPDYDRAMPGSLARKTLRDALDALGAPESASVGLEDGL